MPLLNLTTGQTTTSYPPTVSRAVPCDNTELSAAKTPARAELLAGFRAQFRYFYGLTTGYFPIDEGIRDDATSTGIQMLIPTEERPDIPNGRVWCYYDPERPDLLDRAAEVALEKAERSGNVYLTRTLFDRKRATKDSAKPSRIIAVEDAPPILPIPASRVIRTSPGSRQAVYRLVEPVSGARAERLARLIARVVRADRTGTNSNKVLRLVGGLNTKGKYGTPYHVHVESRGPEYTYDALWSAYSALLSPEALAEVEATSQKDRAAVRWPEPKEQWVEYWRKHLGELIVDGMPRVFKLATHSQGHKIFGDEAYIAGWKHESGSWDASTVRYVRAANLIRAGVTDEMAAAMLEAAERPETLRIKGLTAVRNDIRQVVTMARESETDRRGVGGYALVGSWARKRQPEFDIPAEGQVAEEPHVGGRPASLTAEALLAFYHEHAACNVVTMTRAEVAAALHVSPATIYRLNADLKIRGEIAVELVDRRQRSVIRLVRLVKTPTAAGDVMTRAEETLQRVETPQTADCDPQAVLVTHVVLNPALGSASARVPGAFPENSRTPDAAQPVLTHQDAPADDSTGTHVDERAGAREETAQNVRPSQPTLQPSPALVDEPATLEALVADAVDAYGTSYQFGQAKPLERVLAYVAANGGAHYPRQQVERTYRAELERREREREAKRVAEMSLAELTKARKSAERHIASGLALQPQRRPGDTDERHAERVKRWRMERARLRFWRWYHAHLSTLIAERRAVIVDAPLLELLERHEAAAAVELPTVDEPRIIPELEVEPPALAPGADGFSMDCVEYADGRQAWRLWDDATDTVLAEFDTQSDAERYVAEGWPARHAAWSAARGQTLVLAA